MMISSCPGTALLASSPLRLEQEARAETAGTCAGLLRPVMWWWQGGGVGAPTLIQADMGSDILIARYSATGSLLWAEHGMLLPAWGLIRMGTS